MGLLAIAGFEITIIHSIVIDNSTLVFTENAWWELNLNPLTVEFREVPGNSERGFLVIMLRL